VKFSEPHTVAFVCVFGRCTGSLVWHMGHVVCMLCIHVCLCLRALFLGEIR